MNLVTCISNCCEALSRIYVTYKAFFTKLPEYFVRETHFLCRWFSLLISWSHMSLKCWMWRNNVLLLCWEYAEKWRLSEKISKWLFYHVSLVYLVNKLKTLFEKIQFLWDYEITVSIPIRTFSHTCTK